VRARIELKWDEEKQFHHTACHGQETDELQRQEFFQDPTIPKQASVYKLKSTNVYALHYSVLSLTIL